MLIIPGTAKEVVTERWKDRPKTAEYRVGSIVVARRHWNRDGVLILEIGLNKEGFYDGERRDWYDNGALHSESFYIDGKEHGTAKQFDSDGSLIGTYAMDHGTGVDLWYRERGVLSEERHYFDGAMHGFERWWNGDNETVWRERNFQAGLEHGIERQWNNEGRLRRGFPRYFMRGEQVTKRQYLKARELDPSLPEFRDEDNDSHRELPAGARIMLSDR